jgi:uncharacterized protein YndB with AHSA1/START domain
MEQTAIAPVRKSVTVRAGVEKAFRVFTAEIGAWWPASHHIGKSPMTTTVVEGHADGRCYSEHADGTEADWGRVIVWEPPHRLVMAWQVSPTWQYEPDLARSSEVEVTFTPEEDGSTRVELEHRHLERHGEGAASLASSVDSPGGWSGLLALYAERVAARAEGEATR